MSLIHCIYASTAVTPCGPEACAELVQQARANNARYGITGMLLAVDRYFVHILEGEADNVDELFLHIVGDPRHTDVQEIIRETIRARRFDAWHLGFRYFERGAVASQAEFEGWWTDIRCPQELDPQRALDLLCAFAGRPDVDA